MPELTFRGRTITRDRALIMAIINRTPDSFYDGGANFADETARSAIQKAVEEGADVIDIGGVPASPGPEVSIGEEVDRVLPTVEWAREKYPDLVISVDTWRHEVAERVCRSGADLINDTWSAADPELIDVAAEFGAGYICTHTGGRTPRTPPDDPHYSDVVATVVEETTRLAEQAAAKGVPRAGIFIDPGLSIDFGKDTWHCLAILRNVRTLADTGWPVLMAMSNKGFIGDILDADLGDRLVGTLAATAFAANAGASMFRVHQVRETRHTLEMIASINGDRPPAQTHRWNLSP